MKLIITEKPSVAQNIAKVLGVNRRYDGYFEGSGYLISWAFGHLFTLFDAKDYDAKYSKWSLEHYPFVPAEFQYKILEDAGVKKQFATLEMLAKRGDIEEIINATDADREGELIFREISEIGPHFRGKSVRRLWLSSHTPEDVQKGMKELKSDQEMQNLRSVAYLRQWLDWLVGINLTSVATLVFGGFKKTIYVGRVIMPTLKLVYDREMAILDFKVEKYFELEATFTTDKESYRGVYITEEQITKQELVEAIQKAVEAKKVGKVIKKSSKKSNERAPRLFNLTDLQGYITSKSKHFSADVVLKTAQALYENKFITYPRTASRYLNKSQVTDAKRVLNLLAGKYDCDFKFSDSKDIFDDEKVDSHAAIIPTYVIPGERELKEAEAIVYEAIVKRFLAQFLPKAVYESSEVITEVATPSGDYTFKTSARILREEGWLKLFGKEASSDGAGEEAAPKIPKALRLNQSVAVESTKLNPKETTPPKHYTEATLLSAMENCGKRVDSAGNENKDKDALLQVLKGYSIGTSATRAETLQKLKRVEYIVMSGKNILITDRGSEVIRRFPVKELLDPDFTGRMEKQLKDVERGKLAQEHFLQTIKDFVIKGVNEIKAGRVGPSRVPLGVCPSCGEGRVFEGQKGFGCSRWKEGCKFVLWKDNNLVRDFKLEFDAKFVEKILQEKCVTTTLYSPKSQKSFQAKLLIAKVTLPGSTNQDRWGLQFDRT
ncbi:MAG: type IA DNA topoisomerase [Oligoflexia bacterium]|nr:type IA DNA topoisomerase [Oligoflexia bacterium]